MRTRGGDCQGSTDLLHLRRGQRADEADPAVLLDRLNVIEIDRRIVLQAFLDSDRHFARCATSVDVTGATITVCSSGMTSACVMAES